MTMKYSKEVDIELPVDKVLELMQDPENMKHWQPDLLGYEPLDDNTGEVGSQMKLRFRMGKREIEMIETVLEKDLPKKLVLEYTTNGVNNVNTNVFQQISENKTKWIQKNEFQFKSIPMKIFGFLMPGAFKKQSQEYLDNFKEFAESRGK